MKLYIIGNGFDLHHKLKTGYDYYKDFLEKYYCDVLSGYESFQYLNFEDYRWSNVEQSLIIDYEALMEDAMASYPSAFEDGDSKWSVMQIDVEMITSFINKFTGECFAKWLNSVNIQSANPDKNLNLSNEDLYINYNYTNTLQLLYKIPERNILHIHGKLLEVDDGCDPSVREKIQFGAADINSESAREELTNKYKEMDFFGVSVEPAIREVCGFIEKSTKKLAPNYHRLKAFLKDKEISEIIVMGHSLSGADIAYYRDIFVPNYKNIRWTFMRHIDIKRQQDNINEIEAFIKGFKLSNFQITKW